MQLLGLEHRISGRASVLLTAELSLALNNYFLTNVNKELEVNELERSTFCQMSTDSKRI